MATEQSYPIPQERATRPLSSPTHLDPGCQSNKMKKPLHPEAGEGFIMNRVDSLSFPTSQGFLLGRGTLPTGTEGHVPGERTVRQALQGQGARGQAEAITGGHRRSISKSSFLKPDGAPCSVTHDFLHCFRMIRIQQPPPFAPSLPRQIDGSYLFQIG